MFCPECGADVEEAQENCPQCCTRIRQRGLLGRLWDFFSAAKPRAGLTGTTRTVIRTSKVERFTLEDKTTGERRVFNSPDELPPELRARFDEALAQRQNVSSAFACTFKGPDGQQQTYRSLDDMPPGVRAIYEQFVLPEIRAKVGGLADDTTSPNEPAAEQRN